VAFTDDDLDQFVETSEIWAVEGQQPALAIGQHRRDDVCIMDLAPAE